LKGYAPVIAHPERNSEILQSPGKLYKLIEKGVLVQMNAGSLLGDFGSKVQEIAKLFLQNKFVNFVGSDTHHYKKRNSKLSLWVEEASKYINVEYACDMVTTFPKSILESKERLFEEPEMFENYEEIKPKNALKRILDRLLG
jgi:protein-tyrosine phosphatase